MANEAQLVATSPEKLEAGGGQTRQQFAEGLITTKQILKLVPISRRTLDARRKSGEIPYIQLGDRILFDWPSVHAALMRRQRGQE